MVVGYISLYTQHTKNTSLLQTFQPLSHHLSRIIPNITPTITKYRVEGIGTTGMSANQPQRSSKNARSHFRVWLSA